MKRRPMILSIILFLILIPVSSNCDDDLLITPHKVTKEELGGEISIPNRDGEYDTYTDVDTYEDLYSVLEDLSVDYGQLLEEYNSAQSDIEELNLEIQNLKDELKNSNNMNSSDSSDSLSDILIFISIPIILYGIPLTISHIIGKIKNKKK